ncbi:MAG: hypothetical protein EZS28_026932 [Streblomastix strix]|uniref:Uncharacterized protein n=1 Tax=Streblomastix strix TaxID=222440 RepID=A0A5J4V5Z1_9EUKA|nr:MAG: hypothetical protein EZS28_026932 [Streblomastix strix]
MLCLINFFGAGIVLVSFILSGILSQHWNRQESFPLPSAQSWTNTPILDNSTDGLAVFAHISDLHIGLTEYLTENASILYNFIKNIVRPIRIFNTGDLTNSASYRQYFKPCVREQEWIMYQQQLLDADLYGCDKVIDMKGNHDTFGVGNVNDDADLFFKYASCRNEFTSGVLMHNETIKHINGEIKPYYFLFIDSTSHPGAYAPFNFVGDLISSYSEEQGNRKKKIEDILFEQKEMNSINETDPFKLPMLFVLSHYSMNTLSSASQQFFNEIGKRLDPYLVPNISYNENRTLDNITKVKEQIPKPGGNTGFQGKKQSISRDYHRIGSASWRDQGAFNIFAIDNGVVAWKQIFVPLIDEPIVPIIQSQNKIKSIKNVIVPGRKIPRFKENGQERVWIIPTNPPSSYQTSSRIPWWMAAKSTHIRALIFADGEISNEQYINNLDNNRKLNSTQELFDYRQVIQDVFVSYSFDKKFVMKIGEEEFKKIRDAFLGEPGDNITVSEDGLTVTAQMKKSLEDNKGNETNSKSMSNLWTVQWKPLLLAQNNKNNIPTNLYSYFTNQTNSDSIKDTPMPDFKELRGLHKFMFTLHSLNIPRLIACFPFVTALDALIFLIWEKKMKMISFIDGIIFVRVIHYVDDVIFR